MTAWKTAFFIPHRLRLHVNTVPWICGLGMGLAVSLMPGSGLSIVWPWVAGASAAVAVLPDLQSLRWVYVKLLRPWMLAADEYFAAWVVVWPILLGGTAPHQGCKYRHRKRLLKAGHRNTVGLSSGVRTIDTLLAAAASRETVYHKQWQQQCKIAALRERTSNAGFAALIVDGAHVIDVVVMQQDFAEGAAPDRAVCRTREEQPRILVVPAKELKMPFQVHVRDFARKVITVDGVFGAASVAFLKAKLLSKTCSVPPIWPLLKYQSTLLDDDRTLAAYGITNNANLEMTCKVLGGAVDAAPRAAESSGHATASASQDTAGATATDTSDGDLGLHSAQELQDYWAKCNDLRAAIRARNHQGRPGRYNTEDTARSRFIDGWVMPALMRGKLPHGHDDTMLFLGPKAALAKSTQLALMAWARDVNTRYTSSPEELANPSLYKQQTLRYVLTKAAEKLPATMHTGRPSVEYTFRTGIHRERYARATTVLPRICREFVCDASQDFTVGAAQSPELLLLPLRQRHRIAETVEVR